MALENPYLDLDKLMLFTYFSFSLEHELHRVRDLTHGCPYAQFRACHVIDTP